MLKVPCQESMSHRITVADEYSLQSYVLLSLSLCLSHSLSLCHSLSLLIFLFLSPFSLTDLTGTGHMTGVVVVDHVLMCWVWALLVIMQSATFAHAFSLVSLQTWNNRFTVLTVFLLIVCGLYLLCPWWDRLHGPRSNIC